MVPSERTFAPPSEEPYDGLQAVRDVDGVEGAAGVAWLQESQDLALVSDYRGGGIQLANASTGEVVAERSWLPSGYARDVTQVDEDTAVLAWDSGFQYFRIGDESLSPLDWSDVDAHNVESHPDEWLLYVSNADGEGATNRIVVANDGYNPEALATFGDHGCHDTTIRTSPTQPDRLYCAAIGETQIWDIEDPADPQLVTRVRNPAVSAQGMTPTNLEASPVRPDLGPGVHHWATSAYGGDLLIVGDEHAGALAPGCAAHAEAQGRSASTTAGALWFYDVTDEQNPRLLGWFSPDPAYGDEVQNTDPRDVDPPDARTVVENGTGGGPSGLVQAGAGFAFDGLDEALRTSSPYRCTSHFGDVLEDRGQLVIGWYTAGVLLVDFSDPRNPTLVDRYDQGTNAWDARVNDDGQVFVGDLDSGATVLELV